MANTIKVDVVKEIITIDRAFAKNCEDPYSPEYKKLQEVIKDFPQFRVIRKTIKSNPSKETYAGLTYDYMSKYILSHGTPEEIAKNLRDYTELKLIAECHSKGHRYPLIKKWFLETYPEIVEWGFRADMPKNVSELPLAG